MIGRHDAEQALDVAVQVTVLPQRGRMSKARVVHRVAVQHDEMRAADPAAGIGFIADVERVAGRIGAEGEQVVVREQLVHIVEQAAQVGRAVGQLHAVALQVARPADRILGVELRPDADGLLAGQQAQAGGDAAAADLHAVRQAQVAEEGLGLGLGPEGGAEVEDGAVQVGSVADDVGHGGDFREGMQPCSWIRSSWGEP